jgi:hypothetical protein
MLIEADEIEAAFAITNVFVRVAGSDLDIAKKQQDVIRLREDNEKAEKLAAAASADIEPLVNSGLSEEAQAKLDAITAKIEASDQSQSVKKMTLSKLNALAVSIASAKKGEARREEKEAIASLEISDRLKDLEEKLEAAQATFGTVIRSIHGFAEYSGDFSAASNKEMVGASLKEKILSGEVSNEKVDNMVKAKAEHVGIIRELDVLNSDPSRLSVIQKGRLANLRATANTALDLLNQAIP